MTTWFFQRVGYAVFQITDLDSDCKQGQVKVGSPEYQLDTTLFHTKRIQRKPVLCLAGWNILGTCSAFLGWVARESKAARAQQCHGSSGAPYIELIEVSAH